MDRNMFNTNYVFFSFNRRKIVLKGCVKRVLKGLPEWELVAKVMHSKWDILYREWDSYTGTKIIAEKHYIGNGIFQFLYSKKSNLKYALGLMQH